MKKRTTAQALGFSVLSLLLCVSMLIGTTFAWFTDSVSSARNTIQSGNLDIQLYYTYESNPTVNDWIEVNEGTDIFGYDRWEPGYTKVAYFKVVNNGTLALKYQLNADVYAETAGKNKAGATFLLSDYIKTAIVSTSATREQILALTGDNLKGSIGMSANSLLPGQETIVGFALWMPTTVTNEANHNGTNVPSIEFGINLVATQFEYENDGFNNNDYDMPATMPSSGTGSVAVVENQAENYVIPVKNAGGNSVGTVTVDPDSVADDAINLNVSIIAKNSIDPGATTQITSDQAATTYEISVDGLKDGNTEPVKVVFFVGKGLTNVKLYHNDGSTISEVTNAVYNAEEGKITFEATSFSPFTVVYDEVAEVPAPTLNDLPKATITNTDEHVGEENVEWAGFGDWSPAAGIEAVLDAAYIFQCQDDEVAAANSPYANWYCDFFVKLDRDLGENEIFLAGQYGSFPWIGFHNKDITLSANEEIGLLSGMAGAYLTYYNVAQSVGTFKCGVGNVGNSLSGATFTVALRLTNPEDPTEFYDVEKVEYKFPTVVTTGEELQDAINNAEDGDTIVLGDDIDLSEGLVIPGLE